MKFTPNNTGCYKYNKGSVNHLLSCQIGLEKSFLIFICFIFLADNTFSLTEVNNHSIYLIILLQPGALTVWSGMNLSHSVQYDS